MSMNYRIYDISMSVAVEVTDTPLMLTLEEVKTLESTGFRCVKIS